MNGAFWVPVLIAAGAAIAAAVAKDEARRDLRSLRSNEKWRDELRRMWAR